MGLRWFASHKNSGKKVVQDQNASNFEKTPHLNTISHCTAVYSQKINTTTHELKYYYLHATRNTNKSSSDQKDQTKSGTG